MPPLLSQDGTTSPLRYSRLALLQREAVSTSLVSARLSSVGEFLHKCLERAASTQVRTTIAQFAFKAAARRASGRASVVGAAPSHRRQPGKECFLHERGGLLGAVLAAAQ